MVKAVAEKWSAWTALERTVATGKAVAWIVGALVVLLGVLNGWIGLPETVASQAARIESLESSNAVQDRQITDVQRQIGYLVCDGLARSGVAGRTAAECAAAYITGGEP